MIIHRIPFAFAHSRPRRFASDPVQIRSNLIVQALTAVIAPPERKLDGSNDVNRTAPIKQLPPPTSTTHEQHSCSCGPRGAGFCEVVTPTPRPETIDTKPRPETIDTNPRPETIDTNPRPETIDTNPRPETLCLNPSTYLVTPRGYQVGVTKCCNLVVADSCVISARVQRNVGVTRDAR
jgi:hypothetical protein